jgi:membrane protein YqaA with SNARE-associated domain
MDTIRNFKKRFRKKFILIRLFLKRNAHRSGFALLIALLAFSDYFLFLIPMTAFLVVSVIAVPKKWFRFSVATTLGSTIGVMGFSEFIRYYGISWVQEKIPTLMNTEAWRLADRLIDHLGAFGLLLFTLLPVGDHPAVVLVSLADLSRYQMFSAVFIAKLIKFSAFAWVAVYAPQRLKKLKKYEQ